VYAAALPSVVAPERVCLVDGFSDAAGWLTPPSCALADDRPAPWLDALSARVDAWLSLVAGSAPARPGEAATPGRRLCAVLFDSISPLLREFGLVSVSRFLQTVRQLPSRAAAVVSPVMVQLGGSDVAADSPWLKSLCTQCTAVGVVTASAARASRSGGHGACALGACDLTEVHPLVRTAWHRHALSCVLLRPGVAVTCR
jgi:hypothetical protein